MLDRAAELYASCIDMGLGEHDNAVMVEVVRRMPRAKAGKASRKPAKSKAKVRSKTKTKKRRGKSKSGRRRK